MGFLKNVGGFIKDTATSIFTPANMASSAISIGSKFIGDAFGQANAKRAFEQDLTGSREAFNLSHGAYKTRYQDTMSDMRAAGLNPILAAGGGFNVGTSPSASAAKGYQAPESSFDLSSTAKNVASAELDRKKSLESVAQVAKIRAEKDLVSQQEAESVQRVENLKRDLAVKAQQIRKMVQEIRTLESKQALNTTEESRLTTLHDKNREEVKLIQKQYEKLVAELEKLNQIAKVYASPGGKYLIWAREILGSLGLNIGLVPGIRGRKKGTFRNRTEELMKQKSRSWK